MRDAVLEGRGMRLLVAEDDRDLVAALTAWLQDDGHEVVTALRGREALRSIIAGGYDLVLLDINLPDISGLDVLARARPEQPGLPIMVISGDDAVPERVLALDAGADDYMLKPLDPDELSARVRALARRAIPRRPAPIRVRDLSLEPSALTVWQGESRVRLTTRQFRVLEYLMRNAGRAVGQEELMEYVWGDEADPFSNSVRVHINAIRKKLGDDARDPRYIRTIIGAGYVMGDG